MTLLAKQKLFARLVGELLAFAHAQGYEVTLGEVYRSPEECARRGFPDSLHGRRLAIDINLFSGDVYLDRTEAHRELGEWWERQHSLARWGGRFSRPDGNHYALADQGIS